MPSTKATLWFWSDWDGDPALRLCSFAAQGLWMRMLCIAAKHDPIGYVAINRVGLDSDAIARMTGGHLSEVESLIEELARNGVFSRDRYGTIYNRRMIRDEKKSRTARRNGKLGGNPALKKEEVEKAPKAAASQSRQKYDKTCRTKTGTHFSQNVTGNAAPVSDGNDSGNSALVKPPDKPWVKPIPIPIPESTSSKPSPSPNGVGGGTGPPKLSANEIHRRLMLAANDHVERGIGSEVIAPILALIEQGCDFERHVLPVVAKVVPNLKKPLGSWGASFLVRDILALKDLDAQRVSQPTDEPRFKLPGGSGDWPYATVRLAIARWRKDPRAWPDILGFPPGDPRCAIPPELLEEKAA